jgi:hypothetical protein
VPAPRAPTAVPTLAPTAPTVAPTPLTAVPTAVVIVETGFGGFGATMGPGGATGGGATGGGATDGGVVGVVVVTGGVLGAGVAVVVVVGADGAVVTGAVVVTGVVVTGCLGAVRGGATGRAGGWERTGGAGARGPVITTPRCPPAPAPGAVRRAGADEPVRRDRPPEPAAGVRSAAAVPRAEPRFARAAAATSRRATGPRGA